jgi:uncharacterized integral membrane protein (TIGR00697 family)
MFKQLSNKAILKIGITLSIYITSIIASDTLGLKLMPFLLGSHLSVGVFSFPVVFLMTDVIGEVYGKDIARMFVYAGFVATGLFIGYSALSLLMPWSKDAFWVRAGYNTVFGVSLRIAVASLIAFIIGEYQDVLAFFYFRKYFGEKFFWLRSNLSNVWSQLLDTIIFMTIAFAGVYSLYVLLNIIISWWLYKVAMGVLYTPLSYVGIHLLRNNENN